MPSILRRVGAWLRRERLAVSGNYFSLLGVEMALGRGVLPQEDVAASPSAVAVLSFGHWTRAVDALRVE